MGFLIFYTIANTYFCCEHPVQTLAILAKFQKKLHRAILDKPEEKEEGEADEEEDNVPEEEKPKEEDDERGFKW